MPDHFLRLTRRELFAIPAVWAFARKPAEAQSTFPGVAYRNYSRCLPDYLRDLAARAYEARNREIAKLTTPQAIRERQRWARATFWRLVGGRPESTPLNARTVGSFERPGYRVEKVVYESRPELHVSANLYIPTTGRPPYPGVLFQMGHTANGKAGDTYQRCCQGLARLGYVVLGFDPMGQGERIYYPNASLTRTRLFSPDDEHTTAGRQMLLVGDTASRFQVWDAVRSLDYLAAHPLVDPKRLASTGQSGGGTLTMMLLAVDDRLAAAIECSGNTENFACANFNPPGSTDDAEQDFVGSGPEGFDRWDLLYPFAPKPLMVTVSDRDFFGTYSSQYIASGWEEFQKLKRVYEVLGRGDRLAWADTPLPHGLSYDSRLHVYNWLGRWLKGETRPITEEPPVEPEPDKVLAVSESGNVVRSFHGQTPFTLTRSRQLTRRSAPLDRLLGVERPAGEVRAAVLRRVPSRGLEIEVLDIPSAPKVWAPAWLFLPKNSDPSRPAIISLEPAGRDVRWHEGELYQSLAQAGCVVCVPDLRGVGDLSPEFSRGAARYARSHSNEDNWAWASLILGKPLLGQRVTDILAVVHALRSHPSLAGRRLTIAALGKMTVPALFAAALEPAVQSLYLAGGLVSYRSIVETEQYTHPFCNFLPHVLEYTDLPEVAASVAPRRIVLAGAVDGSEQTMEPAVVRRIYEKATNVEVLAAPTWDATALGKL
jgi:dienelactone hydrolase